MNLLRIDTPERVGLVASWLADPDNHQWLDFGGGVQNPGVLSLRIMTQKDSHILRLFTAEDGHTPIGVVGLSNVDRLFNTAVLWFVLGEKRLRVKGYASRAASRLLALAFSELNLGAVSAWAVECNEASIRTLTRLNFRPIGRHRRCHRIGGRFYDRLWFDLLESEHQETGNA